MAALCAYSSDHRPDQHRWFETIDADQVDDLMNRRKVRPPKQWDDDSDNKSGGSDTPAQDAKGEGPIGGPVEDI